VTHGSHAALNPHERDTTRAYRIIELRLADIEAVLHEMAEYGATVGAGQMTCATGAASTNVAHAELLATDKVYLSPASANAVAAGGEAHVSAVTIGQFTVTHANSATVDRTYDWLAVRMP
jgi:hypothetical protein